MKVYKTSQIRNIAPMGHGGADKTTLAEACAFVDGVIKKVGSVPQDTALGDYGKEERRRDFSISIALVPVGYADQGAESVKVNFLDTPGYFDFIDEVEEAVAAADTTVIMTDCEAGLRPDTVKAWELCEKLRLPRIFFVANIDGGKAGCRGLLLKLGSRFGERIAPLYLPIRENEKFTDFVSVIKIKDRRFAEHSTTYTDSDILDYSEHNLKITREALPKAVAESNEVFVERYFSGKSFTGEEIYATLREQVATGDMVPVMMGSGVNAQGTDVLMNVIIHYFPSPERAARDNGVNLTTGEHLVANYGPDVDLSMEVFKTITDPFISEYNLTEVLTGALRPDSELFNTSREVEEKSNKIYVFRGKEAIEVTELRSGDTDAMARLNETETGDTLAKKQAPILYNPPQISKPYTYKIYVAENKGDEDRIAFGLAKLTEEDRTLRTEVDAENRQSLLYGIGGQQLEIIVNKLTSRHKAEIMLKKPRFVFHETIRKKTEVAGRYKKQSGGHDQFGDVKTSFKPLSDLGKAYVPEEQIFGGVVPKNYFPAVEKGIAERCKRGPFAVYPVVDLKAVLLDGSCHPVDSSELVFKMTASIAFRRDFLGAIPVLLGPIVTLTVCVPGANTGDVMGDLNCRGDRVLDIESDHHGRQLVRADILTSELYGYGADLRSLSGGLDEFAYEFSRYERYPGDVQKHEVEVRVSLLKGGEE